MHYLLLLEHDCDTMLESADNLGWDVATISGDVVERTNYILQKGYNEHSVQGRGAAPKVMPLAGGASSRWRHEWAPNLLVTIALAKALTRPEECKTVVVRHGSEGFGKIHTAEVCCAGRHLRSKRCAEVVKNVL